MKDQRIAVLCLPLILMSCGPAPDMPTYATPTVATTEIISAQIDLLNAGDQKIFYLLPLSGGVTKKEIFWSGSDWPSYQGSINVRWNKSEPEAWNYESPGWISALLMGHDKRAELSPAEKYDLAFGRYDYPLKNAVYAEIEPTMDPTHGLREGWLVASLYHKEPTPKEISNGDGITVPFGSSDIKALLSYYYQNQMKDNRIQQIGQDRPLNPGTFHVTIANNVAMRGEGLLVDLDASQSTAHYAVKSFASRVEEENLPESDAPSGSIKVLKIRSKVKYISAAQAPTWDPVLRSEGQTEFSKEYNYLLYLRYDNEIIGGKWLTEERPHYLWKAGPVQEFKDQFENLSQLLND